MSGDTEDLTVESALIWTDNPELEYFRSVISNNVNQRIASGLDTEDSLIGESTIDEMLRDKNKRFDSNGKQVSHTTHPRSDRRDTSGLSDLENDTVDNIYLEDIRNDSSSVEEENAELPNDEEVAAERRTTPPKSNRHPRDESHEQVSIPLSNEHFQYQEAEPLPRYLEKYALQDEITLDSNPRNIPGVIYVTDGHCSVIATRANDDPNKTGKLDEIDDTGKGNRRRLHRYGLIVFLALVIVASSTTAVVLLSKTQRSKAPPSSSIVTDGSTALVSDPSPTFAPSGLRVTKSPTQTPEDKSSLTGSPSPSPTESTMVINPTLSATVKPSNNPTKRPTHVPTLSPTTRKTDSPTKDVSKSLTASPTSPPNTESPSNQPTNFSTSTNSEVSTIEKTTSIATPPDCKSMVSTTESCYQNGANIDIEFMNCNPTSDDWFGIFPSWHDTSNLGQPYGWLWACGSQFCRYPVLNGTATLYNANGFGSLRVILLQEDDSVNAGFVVKAVGNSFRLSDSCDP